jgi:hypothetical protein
VRKYMSCIVTAPTRRACDSQVVAVGFQAPAARRGAPGSTTPGFFRRRLVRRVSSAPPCSPGFFRAALFAGLLPRGLVCPPTHRRRWQLLAHGLRRRQLLAGGSLSATAPYSSLQHLAAPSTEKATRGKGTEKRGGRGAPSPSRRRRRSQSGEGRGVGQVINV